MTDSVVIATRECRLALWQAEHGRELLLRHLGLGVSLLPMTTRGDQILDRSLAKVGGKGLFIKELENALEHRREDPADAFVSDRHASLDALPQGAVVGTSSLRRMVQLRALRPDLRIEPLRGNLDTRLRKLDAGEYDAIVLAAAGLLRLGLGARIRARFDAGWMLPAAGQGALGIEIRADATALGDRLATLTHRPTWLAVLAERAVSRALGGNCSVPIAAHAAWREARLEVRAAVGDPDRLDQPLLRAECVGDALDGDAAEALGSRVAQALLDQGAAAYLAAGASVEPSPAGSI